MLGNYKKDETINLNNVADSSGNKGKLADSQEDSLHIAALINGDNAAFDKIFLKYYSRTLVFVNSLVKRQEDAEDIVEDIFVWIWSNRIKLDPAKNFNSFIYTIARNSALNYFKRNKIKSNYENSFPDTFYSLSSDEEFIAQETELLIKLTVENMPPQRRNIFELKHNQQLSNHEIAERLGISVKAVEKHMRLALRDIQHVISAFLAFMYFS